MTEVKGQAVARARGDRAGGSGAWLEFDLHGRATMRVQAAAATASILSEIFAPFRATGLAAHDVTVTGQLQPLREPSHAEHEYRYSDQALHLLKSNVQVETDGADFRVHGTRELLTTVLPLIDCVAVQRDAAMFHAATFAYRGAGIALPAWGGVGKTSTIAKLVRVDGVEFMGDDWAFASGDGQILGYAKPMFIKPHHRPIYPHLFEKRRKPLIPKTLSKPVAELTTLVHPLVTKYPHLAGFTRRWSPEHMMVTPQQALPHAKIATAAPLRASIFVERFDGSSAVLTEQTTEWMVSRMIGNFHSELARHSRDVLTALGATGLVPIHTFFAEKAEVFRRALADKPAALLRVPAAWSADRASDVIVENVLRSVEAADQR